MITAAVKIPAVFLLVQPIKKVMKQFLARAEKPSPNSVKKQLKLMKII